MGDDSIIVIKNDSFSSQIPLPSSTKMKEGYMKKKSLYTSKYTQCWIELDSLHQELRYYSENPSTAVQNESYLKGYVSLENTEINIQKPINLKQGAEIVIRKHSQIVLILLNESLEDAQEWVDCINSSKEYSMTVPQLLNEWKKSGFSKAILKNESDVDKFIAQEYNDYDDELFDLERDFIGAEVEDMNDNKIKLGEIIDDRLVLIIMLRQYGCISYRFVETIWSQYSDFLEEHGVQLIAIGTGTSEGAAKFKKEYSFPGDIYNDKNNLLFKALGCRRGLKYCLSLKSLSHCKKVMSEGSKPTQTDGDVLQLGGIFLFEKRCGFLFRHIDTFLGCPVLYNDITNSVWRYLRDNPDLAWASPTNLDLGIFSTSINIDDSLDGRPYLLERGHKFANHESNLIDFAYYANHFYTIPHDIWVRKLPADFVADQDDIGPLIVAIIKKKNNDFYTLIFHKSISMKRLVYSSRASTDKEAVKYITNKLFGKDLQLKKINIMLAKDDLVEYEKESIFVNFKFGVLLAKKGETTEEQIYMNKKPTADFNEFLNTIGTTINLKDWNGYLGGLDSKADRTGTQSVFTEFKGANIMFHVATMIPDTEGESTIAKKRHIGNDVIVIIFQEGNEKINISQFRSQFNHIFVIVRKEMDQESRKYKYRVEIVNKPGVPPSPPFLHDPPLFDINSNFREFLLTKLINLERMVTQIVPIFKNKMMKVRESQLYDISMKVTKKERKDSVRHSPRSFSPNISPLKKSRKGSNAELISKKNSSEFSFTKDFRDLTPIKLKEKSPSSSPILRKKNSEKSSKELKSRSDKGNRPLRSTSIDRGETSVIKDIDTIAHKENFNRLKEKWVSITNESNQSPSKSPKVSSDKEKKHPKLRKTNTSKSLNFNRVLNKRIFIIDKQNENNRVIISIQNDESIDGICNKIKKETNKDVATIEFSGVTLKSKHIVLLQDCDIVYVNYK